MRNILLFILLLSYLNLDAQDIKIGIFNDKNIQKILLESAKGKYKLIAAGKKIYTLKGNRAIILNYENDGISLNTAKKEYKSLKNISLRAKKKAIISVKLIEPKQKVRKYKGNLNIIARQNRLSLINKPPFDNYLAGVVEAESGTKADIEYYKAQAIICRTYLLKKWNKHQKDGFNLCDGVHCQAYKGLVTENHIIKKSVKKTKDLVVLDENNRLIEALFSANCGGQTNNSEMLWSRVPYLRSVKDPYCIDQKQARWDKTIPLTKFISFLRGKGLSIPDTISVNCFAFNQPQRVKYYTINVQKIKLTSLRFALGLRSTFFNIEPKGNKLIFHGRGYGHGVGMCQEGAMNMAKKGHKYDEIIKFYYTGVKIKPISAMD